MPAPSPTTDELSTAQVGMLERIRLATVDIDDLDAAATKRRDERARMFAEALAAGLNKKMIGDAARMSHGAVIKAVAKLDR